MNKILPFVLLLTARAAFAQETPDTVRLKEIVVTATRLPTVRNTVPAAITVLHADELRKQGIRNVADALRLVSGAAIVETGSYGATTALFMRGGESDYVQLLIDGVQANSPGEAVSWNTISIEDIDRIEIVKGPVSVLYGSDAVAGVVHLITKTGTRKSHGSLSFSGGRGEKVGAQADGSFDTGTLSAELSGGADRLSWSGGVSHFGSEGAYAFNNQHRNTSITARTTWQPALQTDVTASLRYGTNNFHYPTNGLGQLSDHNQFHDGDMLALGVELGHHLSQRVDVRASVNRTQNDETTDDRADNPADTMGFYRYHSDDRFLRQAADIRLNYVVNPRSTFTVGTEWEWQSNRGGSTSPYGDTPEHTEKRDNRAAYGQWLGTLGRIALQAGARAEDNDKFGKVVTYRGGVSAQLTNPLRLRASAGTGFKEPRFFEQFGGGFVIGNPNLEPERSRSIEAGADIIVGTGTFSTTYFAQRFKNLIQYISPADFTAPNYTNVAAASANGLELEGNATVSRFQFMASYTYLDTRVGDEGDGSDASFVNGAQLVRRPRHSGALRATALVGAGNVSLTGNFVGERVDLDFADYPANRVMLPSYARFDVAAEYRLFGNAMVTAKVENFFNEDYQEVLNFPARGRVSFVGVRLAF